MESADSISSVAEQWKQLGEVQQKERPSPLKLPSDDAAAAGDNQKPEEHYKEQQLEYEEALQVCS
jgi:hypothetical protein